MWTCKRCQRENDDAAAFCPQCGGPRAAGRFGQAAGRREKVFRTPKGAYRVPDTGVTERKRRRGRLHALAWLAGACLAVLLPVWTAALAVLRYDDVSSALLPLLLGPEAPGWLGAVLYGLMALAAVLLSLLPGLWTMLLAGNSR